MRLHSRRVVTPAATIQATVSVADGVFASVTLGRPAESMSSGDRWVVPGLIDTHVHHPDSFLAPCVGVLERLLAAGGGGVAVMTIAPELPGALAVIAALARAVRG